MSDNIPEELLKTLEEEFGSHFVRHTGSEGASGAGEVASV